MQRQLTDDPAHPTAGIAPRKHLGDQSCSSRRMACKAGEPSKDERRAVRFKTVHLPGKPMAHNSGRLSITRGLLWGIVACYVGLLGFSKKLPLVLGREWRNYPYHGPHSIPIVVLISRSLIPCRARYFRIIKVSSITASIPLNDT